MASAGNASEPIRAMSSGPLASSTTSPSLPHAMMRSVPAVSISLASPPTATRATSTGSHCSQLTSASVATTARRVRSAVNGLRFMASPFGWMWRLTPQVPPHQYLADSRPEPQPKRLKQALSCTREACRAWRSTGQERSDAVFGVFSRVFCRTGAMEQREKIAQAVIDTTKARVDATKTRVDGAKTRASGVLWQ